MNSILLQVLSGPFSFRGFMGLMIGVAGTSLAYWAVDKFQHRQHHSMRTVAVLSVVFFYFIFYIAIQNEINANTVERLSANVTECNKQFFKVLGERADINNETNRLSDERDVAASEWLGKLQNPPAEIAPLRWEDPRRQAWIHELAGTYQGHVNAIQEERRASIENLKHHPLPEPTCGKS